MAMEAILGLEPLHLNVEAQARRASIRLNDWSEWNSRSGVLGHARIWEETVKSNPLLARKDAIRPVLIPAKRSQVIIPPRELWLEPKPDFLRPGGLIW